MVDLAHQAHGQGNVQVDAQHIDSLLAEYAQCFVLRIVGDYLTDLLIAEARGLYNAGDLKMWGSRPEPEAVIRSVGMSSRLTPGFFSRKAAMSASTRSARAGLEGA